MKHNPPGSIKRELPDSPFSPWPREDDSQGNAITFDRQAPYVDPLVRAELSDDTARIEDFNSPLADATGWIDSPVPFPAGSSTSPAPQCAPDFTRDVPPSALDSLESFPGYQDMRADESIGPDIAPRKFGA